MSREKQKDRKRISHTASTMKGFTVSKRKKEWENRIAKMKEMELLIVNPEEEYSALVNGLENTNFQRNKPAVKPRIT